MKRLLCMFVLGWLFMACGEPDDRPAPINVIVGESAWVDTHGAWPDGAEDDHERIATHLRWVLAKLRRAETSHLTREARTRRAAALAELSRYIETGAFPRRTAGEGPPGRAPMFADAEGRLCAVGHLIAATTSREVALRIDRRHRYDRLLDMTDPAIGAWATHHGFRPVELAMIQPAYKPSNGRDLLWGIGLGHATLATGLTYKRNLYTDARYTENHDPESLRACRERTGNICIPAPIYPPTWGLQLQATAGWDIRGARPALDLDLLFAMPFGVWNFGNNVLGWNLGLGLGAATDGASVALAPTGILGVEWHLSEGWPPLSLIAEWRPHLVGEQGWRPELLAGGLNVRYHFGR